MPTLYVLLIWGGVEPSLHGPYATLEERDAAALRLHAEHGDESGYYPLDVAGGGDVEVSAFTSDFFTAAAAAIDADALRTS